LEQLRGPWADYDIERHNPPRPRSSRATKRRDLAPYPDYEPGRASGITRENFTSVSPLRLRRPLDLPVAIGAGANEPPKFRLQTALFAEHLAAPGARVETIDGAGHDHFSIIAEFGRDGALTRALLKVLM